MRVGKQANKPVPCPYNAEVEDLTKGGSSLSSCVWKEHCHEGKPRTCRRAERSACQRADLHQPVHGTCRDGRGLGLHPPEREFQEALDHRDEACRAPHRAHPVPGGHAHRIPPQRHAHRRGDPPAGEQRPRLGARCDQAVQRGHRAGRPGAGLCHARHPRSHPARRGHAPRRAGRAAGSDRADDAAHLPFHAELAPNGDARTKRGGNPK